ncbi:MAG: C-terminal helicase domain-containing protein, partial [Acidobacteriota bacterium]
LCDTPYILDQECRISPKLHELANILEETLEEPENQVLIFSEWERMLQLVRDLAGELDVEYAWHTGSVPQLKRREEIRRFKEDPNCRLFLSTDSGSTGLNLQNANYVINLDLPWNPARLEQRIARAWRKHQTRPVSVINLITEASIEHRMLYLLDQKQKVADAVLDLKGDLDAVKLPSGRAAFVERLELLLSVPEEKLRPELAAVGEEAAPSRPALDPYQAFCEQLSDRLEDQLLLLESRPAASGGPPTLLMVVEEDGKKIQSQASRLLDESFADAEQKPHLELLDRNAYEAIQRLIQAGVLQMPGAEGRPLHRSPRMEDDSEKREAEKRLRQARQILSQAERKMKMARLLSQGGFPIEALPALNEAVEAALHSLACLENLSNGKEPVPLERIESTFESAGHLPDGSSNLVSRLREAVEGQQDDESDAQSLVEEGQRLWESARVAVVGE